MASVKVKMVFIKEFKGEELKVETSFQGIKPTELFPVRSDWR